MKYITPLALFAITLFSSTANADLNLCPRNKKIFDYEDDEFFFPSLQDSEHEICLDIMGEFKVGMPSGSNIIFLAKKGNIKKTWSVDLYGALKLPLSDKQPILEGFNDKIRVCSYLPSEFRYMKKTEIQFGVQILRPGKEIAICLGGELQLL
ncbi:hypothetical protein EC957_011715 [Mortierella hygrophila]|uniref:Uncharacterized protein n=1 Tax=Mortierella hygrophila TaxID=979708 RepID=A0A9P6F7D0_9FUNG|nr:hypothetical protein EC957_011715 [Mortierella hygrophila]